MHRQLGLFVCCMVYCTASSAIDMVQFGDATSEDAHDLKVDSATIIEGAMGAMARQLLPPDGDSWRGGRMTFRMNVDSQRPNYVTVKFWGSDTTGEHSRLMLFLEGKQIGQRHLGEVDSLDISEDRARFPGRFFYKTLPLPMHMTQGKSNLEFAIEAQGPVWGYGREFERFQKSMKEPARGIYRAYVHTESYIEPAADEPQADSFISFPVRREPGEEVLKEVKDRVNNTLESMMKSDDAASADGIRFLAYACFVSWTRVYHQKDALNKVVRSIDHYAQEVAEKPEIVQEEWSGAGPVADAVRVLGSSLEVYLDHKIDGTEKIRRKAWGKLFAYSRNWHVMHRRSYTNQAMTVDQGIYRCNRALAVVDPSEAWPEDMAIRLLHEAAGLKPWSGSLDDRGRHSWEVGRRFMQLTDKGLTKELGYVGHYGEIVTGIVRTMYESSRPSRTAEGDPELKAQLIKIARARTVFRNPIPDDDGFKSMRAETVIGWRDWHYPGDVMYDQMPSEEGAPLDVACATMDPLLIGCGQQMIEDGQFFAAVQELNKRRGVNVLTTMLRVPENYQLIANYPKQNARLPTSLGQPDFVFADPQTGVVALKHGEEILFASLYWRARYAINFLARVHYLTPTIERDATVNIETRFTKSGQIYKMPDLTNEPFKNRHERHYKDEGMHLGMADQLQPIARVPASFKDFKPGDENIHAGKGDFYLMYYGPYCVAMNCSDTRAFTFDIADEFLGAKNLVNGEIESNPKRRVDPSETLVLYRRK